MTGPLDQGDAGRLAAAVRLAARSPRAAISSAGKGRRQNITSSPGGQLELSGRVRRDDPPNLYDVNEHPAAGARWPNPIERGLHRSGPAPIWRARGDAADPQGALQADGPTNAARGAPMGTTMSAGPAPAGEPRCRLRGRQGQRSCACRWRCNLAPPRSKPFALLDGAPNGQSRERPRPRETSTSESAPALPWRQRGVRLEAGSSMPPRCAESIPSTENGRYNRRVGQSFRDSSRASLPALPGKKLDAHDGRSPDHPLPSRDQEIHRDARRRWWPRPAARCRPSGSG